MIIFNIILYRTNNNISERFPVSATALTHIKQHSLNKKEFGH